MGDKEKEEEGRAWAEEGSVGGLEGVQSGVSWRANFGSETLVKKIRKWESRPCVSYQMFSSHPGGVYYCLSCHAQQSCRGGETDLIQRVGKQVY